VRRKAFLLLAVAFWAPPAWARPLTVGVSSDTLLFLAGNSIVDIVYDTVDGTPTVWVGTGTGASVSHDLGITWRSFTTASGLSANSVSALGIAGSMAIVGMAHNQDFSGDLFPVGDGFSLTTNAGESWDTSRPAQATGIGYFSQQIFGMLPFDLTGEPSGIWSACFFGGLLRSTDGGVTWFNIWPSDSSRIDFITKSYTDLANRFFAVTAGALNGRSDSVQVFAGSADGINRLLVIDAKIKLAGAPVFTLHTNPLGGHDWLGTAGGISRVTKAVPHITTSYFDSTTNGTVPAGLFLSSAGGITPLTDELVVFGAFDTSGTDTVGLGVLRSSDAGAAWTLLSPPQLRGAGAGPYDLVFTHQALWAAAGDSGLFRSTSNPLGDTWTRVFVDTLVQSPGAAANRVYSLAYDSLNGTLYVGTRNGVYRLTLGAADNVVAREPALYAYTAGDTTRAAVVRSLGVFYGQGNRLLLWAATHPEPGDPLQRSASLFSNDSGVTWQTVHRDLLPWGFAYLRDTVYAATQGGLLVVPLESGQYVSDTVVRVFETVQGRTDSTELVPAFRAVATIRDTLFLGGDAGWARRRPGNLDWEVTHFIPRDSVDLLQATKFVSGDAIDSGISGNFVIALNIQQYGGTRTVWASTRPVSSPQFLAVSKSTDDGRTWTWSLTEKITWNIASYRQHVWAATSEGLFHTTDGGAQWTAVPVTDAQSGSSFLGGVEVLSVRQLDDSIVLVGSEDGLARSTDLGASWSITRSFVGLGTAAAGGEDVDVYASPVPFSPSTSTRLRVHYKPEQDGPVTIEVFDFAMQKVATLLDGEYRAGRPGADPFGTNHYYEEWDATNDNGQPVATGVYFFRVESSDGTRWGKLVILP
jgi:hypothetical protein